MRDQEIYKTVEIQSPYFTLAHLDIRYIPRSSRYILDIVTLDPKIRNIPVLFGGLNLGMFIGTSMGTLKLGC